MKKIITMLSVLSLSLSLTAKENTTQNQENNSQNIIFIRKEMMKKADSLDFNVSKSDNKSVMTIRKEDLDNFTHYQSGVASFYSKSLNGSKTSNGERHVSTAMVAAHKSLPFGTKVKVTNLNNGKSVIVRINDRGPFVKGRVIDLSYAAFSQIESPGKGVTKVELQVLK
ncbi:septal ring lytic transglycosylase RlpA family protein [Leptotrichia sp. oral taxon 218]|jgi:rare lipoprotein A|uniref:septal ring lytic transglycosylase RlpA family protein n=1 Tax=Leptotrichia sp. oral taxon 218 TaxID=712361 RepID=UPI002012318A|nr:septal ring lytic transglycosylase RlpA family protein [Leptotrichia sp. oral taxon 218]